MGRSHIQRGPTLQSVHSNVHYLRLIEEKNTDMVRALRMVFILTCCAILVGGVKAQSNTIASSTFTALAQSERARVIITLRDPAAADAPLAERRGRVAAAQDAVFEALTASGGVILRRFSLVPGFVAEIDAAALPALMDDPRVLYVQADEPGGIATAESVPALGAHTVHSLYGLTGAGVRAAVLDSGVDTDHPDLADDLVAQACFTGGGTPALGACPPGNTTTGTSAEDANGHGTNVTGIITAGGVVAPVGFAPDAEIVAVRVLDSFGSGWLSDWTAALDWLSANQETLHVDVVNMSLGSFIAYAPNCDAEHPSMASAVNLLRNYWDIPTFAATGNQGEPFLTAAPACISSVIAVGATYDSALGREPDSGTWRTKFGGSWPTCFDDPTGIAVLTCFTNGGGAVDVVAPGAYITSAGLGGGTSRYAGTSQAAPTAAGVAALMLQARPALSPDVLEATLKATGVLIDDPRSAFEYRQVNALAAVESVLTLLPTPTQIAPLDRAVTGTTPIFTWTPVAGSDAYYFWLSHADGTKILNVWLDPTVLCDAVVCAFESYFPLKPGAHRWWVQAWDSALGESPWSPMAVFEVIP